MARLQLLWFGRPPTDEEELLVLEHGFQLVIHRAGIEPDFRFGRAAIFWATQAHFAPTMTCLRDYVAKALNEGLYVVPVVSGGAGDLRLKEVNNVLKVTDKYKALEGHYRARSAPLDLHQLLHQFLQHDPGPARSAELDVQGASNVSAEDRLLLERAFHDCSSVRLKPIDPGLSGANTFIVDATLTKSNAGPEPMPFFMKLGNSGKLKSEMEKFQVYAEHHVPWYLRPNFVAERSNYGVPRGILVGTFVQGSKSLGECVRSGDGARYIKSLFEETLAGLRRKVGLGASAKQRTVVDALEVYCNHERVPTDRWKAASVRFGGAAVDPKTLWWRLLGLPAQDWMKSAIHGDLHGDNVRVRKGDAIVIDFAHAGVGPACADLAHLDVWISFDSCGDTPTGAEWRTVVENLYSPGTIDASLKDPATVGCATWIQASIAEVRAQAAKSVYCHEEYRRVLAVYLLRQASFPAKAKFGDEDEHRRTFAYWLACRLVDGLEIAAPATVETA